MPIGVWAHWCVQTSVFNGAVLIMICVSALMLGAQTELDPVAYWKVRPDTLPAPAPPDASMRTHTPAPYSRCTHTQTALGR